jgi:meso-butanediol dehydrogenase/(S,S)-butanediol dehydrogenase/diacetyl reductase
VVALAVIFRGIVEDKVIIVTGAGTGIGAATARRFLREGATVVLNGRREQKLRDTITGTDAAKSLIHAGDVSDEAYIKQLVEDTVARFGRLDVLVNNAEFAIFGPFAELTTADWRRQLSTDLDGVYFGTREALPHLLKTRGSIVNVSSASGLGGDWGGSGYNAAKGAVSNLTRSLALEYAARGVRVNAVAPSLTTTDATAELVKSEAVMSTFRGRLPMGRPALPDGVAAVIAFLASDDASFVNGVILPVDGGMAASNGQPNFLALFGQG